MKLWMDVSKERLKDLKFIKTNFLIKIFTLDWS